MILNCNFECSNTNFMKTIKKNYLSNLNKNQVEAITNPDGPCLIVAGAGSGKTKVLTSRATHIIKEKKSLAQPNFMCHVYKQSIKRNAK